MKTRIVINIACIIGMLFSAYANGPRSPKELGAGWAKSNDRAAIELLLNTLENTPENSPVYRLLADRLQGDARIDFKGTVGPAATDAAREIYIAGNDASVEMPDGNTLTLAKVANKWVITNGVIASHAARSQRFAAKSQALAAAGKLSAGQTFIPAVLSDAHGIDQLSRQVTRQTLDRELFGAPEKSASFYSATYSQTAPYVTASYIQLVTDPSWNRILYGSLDRWIKAYDDLEGPSAIAVDADGRVFVAETGRQRVAVLQLNPDAEDTELTYRFEIPAMNNPLDIAHNDNGTPLDVADDFLYVVNGAENKIVKLSLAANSADVVATFEDFQFPSAILSGRWEGSHTRWFYVIDNVGKRLRVFEDSGSELLEIATVKGGHDQYFSALKADHFGNIYVVDNVHSRLFKYTADLTLLDISAADSYSGLSSVEIPFGKVVVEGEGTYWSGYDQLFSLERWSENSGVQRRVLGASIKDAGFQSDDDISRVASDFTLTDAGDLEMLITDANGKTVRTLRPGRMSAGSQSVAWQRRDNAGNQVTPGTYRYRITAHSPYREAAVSLGASFYLPLYYHIDGRNDADADRFLVQGSKRSWGTAASQSVHEDPRQVVYQFNGLNPNSEYAINLEAIAGDGEHRAQVIRAENGDIVAQLNAGDNVAQTGYITLEKAWYADGRLRISIENENDGSAVVSQLWLKETGVGLVVTPSGDNGEIPTTLALDQNYPNPFNPETQIRFQLPADATVKLELFNVLGQRVRLLANGNYAAGYHTLRWDGRNESGLSAASGIYIYRLTSGQTVLTKRMLLLK